MWIMTTSCLDLKDAVCVRKSRSFSCFFKLTKIMLVFGQGAIFEQTSESDFRVSSLIRRVREIETIFVFSLVAILREFQALAVNFKQFIKSILK